jgi:hypothetical protein
MTAGPATTAVPASPLLLHPQPVGNVTVGSSTPHITRTTQPSHAESTCPTQHRHGTQAKCHSARAACSGEHSCAACTPRTTPHVHAPDAILATSNGAAALQSLFRARHTHVNTTGAASCRRCGTKYGDRRRQEDRKLGPMPSRTAPSRIDPGSLNFGETYSRWLLSTGVRCCVCAGLELPLVRACVLACVHAAFANTVGCWSSVCAGGVDAGTLPPRVSRQEPGCELQASPQVARARNRFWPWCGVVFPCTPCAMCKECNFPRGCAVRVPCVCRVCAGVCVVASVLTQFQLRGVVHDPSQGTASLHGCPHPRMHACVRACMRVIACV